MGPIRGSEKRCYLPALQEKHAKHSPRVVPVFNFSQPFQLQPAQKSFSDHAFADRIIDNYGCAIRRRRR
jgi:hypothetical protein